MAHIELRADTDATDPLLVERVPPLGERTHWSASCHDPNDPVVVRDRAQVLAAAWRPAINDRTAFICERVRGRSVMDIGCVAHDDQRMESNHWLHAHVADAADTCIGVDILEDGVAAMRAVGYNAVVHDLSNGLGPLVASGPYQAMVAGELIEHVGNLDMLFSAAAEGLSADGELIVTTPNPYAPARVRAGQRGDVWENVDHILYAFPSGIAELASRHGLILAEAATTRPDSRTPVGVVRWLKRTVRRSHWHRRGFSTANQGVQPAILDRKDLFDRLSDRLCTNAIAQRLGVRRRFTGETFVYVIQRAPLV